MDIFGWFALMFVSCPGWMVIGGIAGFLVWMLTRVDDKPVEYMLLGIVSAAIIGILALIFLSLFPFYGLDLVLGSLAVAAVGTMILLLIVRVYQAIKSR